MTDVVMPCWIVDEQLLELTRNAVHSLQGHRLIIIDNGSPMGGGQLREWADVYIRNKENLGYAKAVNQGLNLAGDIVAVSNNDIRVSENWAKVAKEILKDSDVGTVHFRMIPYDSPLSTGAVTWKTGKEHWTTGSFFVMRNRWRFDENFLNSYDDWDLQYRIRKGGFSTAYTNIACYRHLDSTTQQKVEKRNENDEKNREYFKKKHGEYPENLWYRLYPDQMNMEWKPFP